MTQLFVIWMSGSSVYCSFKDFSIIRRLANSVEMTAKMRHFERPRFIGEEKS
jgi:hypothetical protein